MIVSFLNTLFRGKDWKINIYGGFAATVLCQKREILKVLSVYSSWHRRCPPHLPTSPPHSASVGPNNLHSDHLDDAPYWMKKPWSRCFAFPAVQVSLQLVCSTWQFAVWVWPPAPPGSYSGTTSERWVVIWPDWETGNSGWWWYFFTGVVGWTKITTGKILHFLLENWFGIHNNQRWMRMGWRLSW